jgi:hypothetical protein
MIFEKRGQWCFRDAENKLHKFDSENDAKKAWGWVPPVEEILDDEEDNEEEDY